MTKKAKERKEYEIFSFLNSRNFHRKSRWSKTLAAYSDLKIGLDIFPPKDFFFNEKVLYKKKFILYQKKDILMTKK